MRRYAVTLGDRKVEVEIKEEPAEAGGPLLRVITGAGERVIDLRAAGPVRYTWSEGVRIVNAEVEPKGGKWAVAVRGESFVAEVADANVVDIPVVGRPAGAAGPTVLRAPMPGRVVKLLAQPGTDVEAGRGILVVEAMKMENELRAPRAGKLREIRVSEGAAVEAGQDLFVIE